ncbi:MAG TPA: cytochrome c peroxidase [Chitinophagaceae bacterium]
MKKYVIIIIVTFAIGSMGSGFQKDSMTRAELGKLLFFDPILSKNRTISCASCHRPEFAFADTSATSVGDDGKRGKRNTPSAMNVLLQHTFFWDGRAKTLEQQALAPIENPVEMNLPINDAIARLRDNKKYQDYFRQLFGKEPDSANLALVIAAFERTLETSESPFDKWKFEEDELAVSEEVKNGFVIFGTKGKCIQCHFGPNFTQHEFRNIGLFNGADLNDSGRALITHKTEDVGKFKTPGLRNTALTAPYMHNGQFKTLNDVIEFYNDPGKIVPNAINRDTLLAKPLGLTAKEKSDLEAFLVALTDKRFSKK